MVYILYGIIAFGLFFIFDLYTIRKSEKLKKVFGISGLGLMLYAITMAAIASERISIPLWASLISGILTAASALMLIYSLFIELPFINTYGKKQYSNSLVDTGTYALCRHPGVLWFGMMFLFGFLASGALLILICGVIWTCIDIIYVYLQERYLFHKMFPEYERYTRTTPMLIPTKASVDRCLHTIFKGRDESGYFRKDA